MTHHFELDLFATESSNIPAQNVSTSAGEISNNNSQADSTAFPTADCTTKDALTQEEKELANAIQRADVQIFADKYCKNPSTGEYFCPKCGAVAKIDFREGSTTRELICTKGSKHNFHNLGLLIMCNKFYIDVQGQRAAIEKGCEILGLKKRNQQARIDAAKNFLDVLFGKIAEKKFSYIWIERGKTDKLTIAFDVSDETARADIAKRAIELNDSGYNVFIGVNLTDNPMSEFERAKKENITIQTAIIADIDIENGLWHVGAEYPADFDTAKNFLPFAPSILVNSGAGLHAYILLKNPLHFDTDSARDSAVSRNKDFLQMIRERAGKFSSKVDSVHDLPRVLRLPGTYNLKNGRENAPMCKVVEMGNDYALDELRELIKAPTPPIKKSPVQTSSTKNNYSAVGDKPSEQERARAMLKVILPQNLSYDEWLNVGMALKNNGNACADWSDWSSQDDRFKIGECESKWSGFNGTGLTIATIHDMAKDYGYSERDFQRKWYLDNKISDVVKSNRKNHNDFTNSDTSILSARVGQVNERTDIFMSTDTKVTNATIRDFISTADAAKILGVSTSTLENWRSRRLFGVPFFTADIMRGGSWYYSRERIEQLKAVYQKGTLQSMYKLARKFSNADPSKSFSDNFQIRPSSSNMDFLTAEEVAKILGVTEMTLTRWREDKIFQEDMLTHDGIYLYAEESVADFQMQRENERRIAENAQIDSLEEELREIEQKLNDFDAEKDAAIEKLKSAVSFDKDFVFSDEILTAAAFANIFNKKVFSDFKRDVQNQINKKKTEKFVNNEWLPAVKEKVSEIKERKTDLLSQQKSINAKIVSLNFIATHADLKDFVIPEGYEISDAGIEKIVGDKSLTVSRVPAVIKSKSKSVEDKTFKLILAYLAENGTWQSVPAAGAEIVFNARKLIDLAAYGLPVTSTNANLFVDYLDAFKVENEKNLPMSLTVSGCGWHDFEEFNVKDLFVEPRRKNFITDADRNIEVIVDDSSTFAQSLKTGGDRDEWRKAYELAKPSPVARLVVAASVAAPLLELLGERNFVLYIYGTTRGGKSTCLLCGASAVGNTDMVISFDGTNNGLLGRAAETTDYAFFVDEKQSADARLKEQFQRFIYSVANGKERQRANKDGSFKSVREWQNITICNGETELLDDNATGGAFTRLLQIHAPKTILAADDCKEIRRIIRHNYGHALPLVIDELFKYGFDKLREKFKNTTDDFAKKFPNLLDDYRRYVAIMTLADTFLNIALDDVDEDSAYHDAVKNAHKIFEFVPTIADISDFEREKDFVLGFISAKAAQFEDSPKYNQDYGREILGKFDRENDGFVYITSRALKQACDESHFDYKKIITDSIENGFFIADNKPRKDRKNFNSCVQKTISGVNNRCYRIPKHFVIGDDSEKS